MTRIMVEDLGGILQANYPEGGFLSAQEITDLLHKKGVSEIAAPTRTVPVGLFHIRRFLPRLKAGGVLNRWSRRKWEIQKKHDKIKQKYCRG